MPGRWTSSPWTPCAPTRSTCPPTRHRCSTTTPDPPAGRRPGRAAPGRHGWLTRRMPDRALSFGQVADTYERARPGYPDAALDWVLPAGARRVADVGAGTGK